MKLSFIKYLKVSVVISIITGLFTWPAAAASFIRWMERQDGRRSHTISELLFHPEVTSPRSDALIFSLAWLIGSVVLFGIVAAISRAPTTSFKVSAGLQVALGICYCVLMGFATVGLW